MKTFGTHCLRQGCIGLCAPGEVYCAVHTKWLAVERTFGLVGPLRVVSNRIEYDREGLPVRFYPTTGREPSR